MARKITLTFSIIGHTGCRYDMPPRQLGICPDKTNHELYRYLVHWLDQSKYRLSTVFHLKVDRNDGSF